MANGFDSVTLEAILAPQTQALQALAMRPQKTSATTTTTTRTTPYALDNMIANRDRIGQTTQELDDILKARESFKYRFGQGLANVTPQNESGAGWLSGFLRGVGGGLTGYVDNRAARAQQKYENEMKDLAEILAFDKAMGDVQTQVQNQVIGYTPMEYGTAGTSKGTGVGGPDQVVKNIATATGEGMDPEEFIKQYNTGGFIESGASDVDARDNPTLAARFIRSAVAPINTGARSALAQNMTDKIIGPKIQNMVQNMGGAKGGDTLREVYARVGPLAQITSLGTQEQLGAISAAKTDVLDIINRDRAAVGMQPLTMEQFQPAWNRLFTGIATYNKQYGEKETNKKGKQSAAQPVEQEEDYSKYGF